MKDDDQERIKAYMAAKMTHIKMYNECMNLADGLDVEKFAELVRADEREACAEVCDLMYEWGYNGASDCAEAIRDRGDNLQTAIKKGTKAWADVADATEWVEELRGNVDKVDMSEERVHKTDKFIHKLDLEAPLTVNGVPLYPKKEWVGLTDEEIKKIAKKHKWHEGNVEPHLMPVFRSLEAKLKEKNSG